MYTTVSVLGNRFNTQSIAVQRRSGKLVNGNIYIHKTVIINKLFHCFAAVYCRGERGEGL
jgi:hypothetical protein